MKVGYAQNTIGKEIGPKIMDVLRSLL